VIQEAESGCIELSDDAPKDVQKMVTFLYTKDYANDESNVCGNEREKKQSKSYSEAVQSLEAFERVRFNLKMYNINQK